MLRKLALSLAVAGIVGTSNAHALGLGEIQIKSALNEPLQAEIQLLQMRDVDSSQIRPRMANIDEFALAGIEKLRFLSDVQFQVKPGPGGRGVIVLQSSAPVKEPFLNFLVEVNWPSGRLVREYTVLLDPPVYDPTPEPVAVQSAQSQAVGAGTQLSAKKMEPAAPVSNIRTRANPDSQIYVDVNDTLWNIAKRSKPEASITEAQMMLALQRKNPAAFEGNNVNRLKAGVVLDIPSLEEIRALTPKQANEEFWRQTQAWKQGSALAPAAAEQLDGARDKQAKPAKKDDEVAASQDQGQLKIVSPAKQGEDKVAGTSATGTDSDLMAKNQQLEAELAAALESVDQIQRENEELTGRVDALAQQMESLQRLLELKDQQLAELQAELDAAKAQPVAPIAQPSTPQPKPGLLEQFGMYIYGGGAALIALLIGLLVMLRRRKNNDDSEAEEVAEQTAPVAAEEVELEEAAAEEVVEEIAEETVAEDATDAVVEELSDDELDDLDLDLDMDLEEVGGEVDNTIDDDEFDLGLDDLDADDLTQPEAADETAMAGMAEELVEPEADDVDDALDSILGEETESLDLDDIEAEPVADDLDALLAEVDAGEEEQELEFDLSAEEDAAADEVVADDLDQLLEEVESADDAELEFDLSTTASAEPEAEPAGDEIAVADELDFDLDVDDVVGGDEAEVAAAEVADELEFDVAEMSESDTVEAEPVEDEAFADLEALLDGAGTDTADDAVSADAESDFADLEDLLGEEAVEETAAPAGDEADDLEALLAEAGEPDVAGEAEPELPDPAELSELHPELENLLDDLDGEDVVLEEQDIALESDASADDELAADLDVALDSELEALLNDAGDDSVALDSTDADDAFDSLNLLEGADEVETKLDLARAYIDMEDMDGAKDILQEIVKEGSDAQQQEANTLLSSLES